MILEFVSGIFVSILLIYSFKKAAVFGNISTWINDVSKFVYFAGHPLLSEDQVHKEISVRYTRIFVSIIKIFLKLFLLFCSLIVAIGIAVLLISYIRSEEISLDSINDLLSFLFPTFLLQLPFLLGTLIPIIALTFINSKKKKKKKKDYSLLDAFLHYIFLGNKYISLLLLKIEFRIYKKQIDKTRSVKSIYISGMARAGTTALMQNIGQINSLKSLSYANLPFLFMPKTWPKYTNKKESKEKERSHKDGMKHSLNSFEALEEPFWRNTIGETFIKEGSVIKHSVPKGVFEKYNKFRKLVAGNDIYLSKNNNHLFRAESIHKLDKEYGNEVVTIIPFRNPYSQAGSLLNQHKVLSRLQEENEFALDYMDFLVHHEFGMNHKLPNFNIDLELKKIQHELNSLEYWLEVWYMFYSEVYTIYSEKPGFHFFCYENFLRSPQKSVQSVLKIAGLSKDLLSSIKINKYKPAAYSIDEHQEEKYIQLYKKLKSISINLNE